MSEQKDDKIIQSITIKLGRRTIELTTEEAQKLKAALSDLFGQSVVKEVIHEHHYPYWQWTWPQYHYHYSGTGLVTPQYGTAVGTGTAMIASNVSYDNGNLTVQI